MTDMRQVGGTHYRDMEIQPWDAMRAWMSPVEFRGFLRGNAIKYLARCDKKGGLEDLRKARHYLDQLIEHELATSAVQPDALAEVFNREAVRRSRGFHPQEVPNE